MQLSLGDLVGAASPSTWPHNTSDGRRGGTSTDASSPTWDEIAALSPPRRRLRLKRLCETSCQRETWSTSSGIFPRSRIRAHKLVHVDTLKTLPRRMEGSTKRADEFSLTWRTVRQVLDCTRKYKEDDAQKRHTSNRPLRGTWGPR
jgi:hypothetical protein